MPSVKDFYKFLWANLDAENLNFIDGGMEPSLTATLSVSEENLQFLQECQNAHIFEPKDYAVLEINSDIEISRTSSHAVEDGVFFNFKQPLLSLDFDSVDERKFYIADINYDATTEKSEEPPKEVAAIFYISSAMKILRETKDYIAGSNLVFFGRETLEIPLNTDPEIFSVALVEELADSVNTDVMKSFSDWFFSDDSLNHQGNKKAILKQSLFDVLADLDKGDRFLVFLRSAKRLAEKTIKSYELYLEDFNYSKFSAKLEEKRIEYYEKISRVISDIRNQIIGLPIVFVLLNIAKQGSAFSSFALFGMLVYCLILLIFLFQQLSYVEDIRNEVDSYTNLSTESISMKSDLITAKNRLNSRLDFQTNVISFFQVLVILGGGLSIFQFLTES